MTTARSIMVVCGLALAVWAAGCQNPDQMQIELLQQRNLELQRENDRLRADLARAISERDAAIARARALQEQLMQQPQPVETGPAGWEYSGPYAWTSVGTDFLFDPGKATLKAEGRAKLQQIVGEMQANFPDRAVWVLGHTDTDPIKITKDKWQDNLDLSCNRAMTVYRELTKMGLTPERMIAGGQGEWFPKADNASRAGKAENRRVEIIAVPPRPAVGTSSGAVPTESGGPTSQSPVME